MSKSEATRARILRAATVEFAAHGLAGARIDRIAESARANKAQIYTYVGSKDRLFDTVFARLVAANVGAVPFSAGDLPGYAAALHDAYLDDPALVRLLAWVRLERVPTGALFAHVPDADVDNLAAIETAQRKGLVVDDVAPTDVWSMLIALAATWAQSAIIFTATLEDSAEETRRRRDALSRTVARAFCAHAAHPMDPSRKCGPKMGSSLP